MGFRYANGKSGVTVNGRDLMEFSCKLLAAFTIGAPKVTTETFQGRDRSSLLLLSQTFGPLEIKLPLEFWGDSREDTMEKWTDFCQTVSGPVELDLGDGFEYHCTVTDLGKPAFITDEWMETDVTLQGMRQKPLVTVNADTEIGASVYCQSTFPRTDCTITVKKAVLGGASMVSVVLGDNSWFLYDTLDGQSDLVLDGVNKVFLLNGENVGSQMVWEDFPYLVPGVNRVGVFVDGIGINRGVEITYRPTFL